MKLQGKVESVFVGSDPSVEKLVRDELEINFEGVVGDRHSGFTRGSGSSTPEHTRDTTIRNDRQWSAVSLEDLVIAASNMGIPSIEPGWIGANFAVSGIPDFSLLPKGSRLIFPNHTVLVVEDENHPCTGAGGSVASKYPDRNLKPNDFPKAAVHRRGILGVVEHPGIIRPNDTFELLVYEPKAYSLPTA